MKGPLNQPAIQPAMAHQPTHLHKRRKGFQTIDIPIMKFLSILSVFAAVTLAAPAPNPGIADGVMDIVNSGLRGGKTGGINQGVNKIVASSVPNKSLGKYVNNWVDYGFSWVPKAFQK